jgi:hypothetical protein
MKTLLVSILILISVTLTNFGQTVDTTGIIDPLEQFPIFPGGNDSLFCFLENKFQFDILNADDETVAYFVRFIIDSSGTAKDFDIIATIPKSPKNITIDSLRKAEILRVFKMMPKWKPAKNDGMNLSCRFTIPIKTPYLEFKCKRFLDKSNIEFKPDSFAQFRIGEGITNQERIEQYFQNNLIWPSFLDCFGKAVIKCIVEKTGKLSGFKFIHQPCPELNSEILRLLNQMPKWKPAIKDNKPVRSVVVITIHLGLK